ncbi:hypothetical protein [Candidatus Halobonum tyrrellensis]|uniref:DUF7975 domain-containing protein n=1 Tax=Candidatus Halobonum tyrrellensis G22 TaxID=1324957 RepID=V4HFS2_9EURY|nr:hypothetical protein [Candidatus Halobonum tyrrellensis]ESP88943.1 hypothetical protein K933_06653 [Candidatus Halobonum tyrrellensis G22]
MTRFDADTPADRRSLFADAVTAHRTRGSAFLTVETDPPDDGVRFGDGDDEADASRGADASGGADPSADGSEGDDDASDEPAAPPWVQFAEDTFNLDCTGEELDRLESTLDDFPEFRIDALDSPDETDGTNVRISARSDANRLAEFLDRTFREVYDRPEDYRAWVTQV